MFNIFKKEKDNIMPGACIVIGRSGCGKGTQVELLKEYLEKKSGLKVLHIEMGSLLRDLVKKESYTSKKTKEIIEVGGLMPESIVIGLWTNYIKDNFTGKENLIFDGSPRRIGEAILLDDALNFYSIKKYNVIYINTSIKWCTEKLLARGRKDDTKEGVEKRMSWFDNNVIPCIEFFRDNKNSKFIDINGEQTIDQVHNELIKKVFDIRK